MSGIEALDKKIAAAILGGFLAGGALGSLLFRQHRAPAAETCEPCEPYEPIETRAQTPVKTPIKCEPTEPIERAREATPTGKAPTAMARKEVSSAPPVTPKTEPGVARAKAVVVGSPGRMEDAEDEDAALVGEGGAQRIHEGFVVVVGLGGVGTHVAEILARSGVGELRVVDPRVVTARSLRTCALLGRDDLGHPVAERLAVRVAASAGHSVEVQAMDGDLGSIGAEALLGPSPTGRRVTIVAECLDDDDVDGKAAVLGAYAAAGVPVVSAMGACGRVDPSKIRVADLADTLVSATCRRIRRRLAHAGVDAPIRVVYSVEEEAGRPHSGHSISIGRAHHNNPNMSSGSIFAHGDQSMNGSGDASVIVGGSQGGGVSSSSMMSVSGVVGGVGGLGSAPATFGPHASLFGAAVASAVLMGLVGARSNPRETAPRGREVTYRRIWAAYAKRCGDEMGAGDPNAGIGERPAAFDAVVERVWGGRCAATGTLLRLRLTTWDITRPAGLDNAVLLCAAEARAHEARESIEEVPSELRKVCEHRLQQARQVLAEFGFKIHK